MHKLSNKIGIMHGRLSEPVNNKIQEFPIKTWKNEFEKASLFGFDSIEWIFDKYQKNPIMNIDGITEIKKISKQTGVKINSVLADYFMEEKLFNVSESNLEKNLSILKTLVKQSSLLGAKIVEIPFVDSSSLKSHEEQLQVISNLETILPEIDEYDMILSFETDLNPKEFKFFINNFNHSRIKINYDVGNSASLGYDLEEEIMILGNLIENIHIKDRMLHGITVPLGTGDVNFNLFFNLLKKINYSKELIIQGARESNVQCEYTAKKYLLFVQEFVDKYLFDEDKLNSSKK